MNRCPMVSRKNALEKNSREKNIKIIWALLLPNLFREGAYMGKIRLEKKKETKKTAFHHKNGSLYGGSKISKTSSSSNNNSSSSSSSYNSNFGGSGLAGPPT